MRYPARSLCRSSASPLPDISIRHEYSCLWVPLKTELRIVLDGRRSGQQQQLAFAPKLLLGQLKQPLADTELLVLLIYSKIR